VTPSVLIHARSATPVPDVTRWSDPIAAATTPLGLAVPVVIVIPVE
jgi:hypothetical protein